MKSRYLLVLYLLIFIISSIFYVPSENYINGKIQFINWLTTDESIDLKKYCLFQIVILVTFFLLNKINVKFEFYFQNWFLNNKKYIYKICLILICLIATWISYEQFINKPRIAKEKEVARIEKIKRDSTERIRLEKLRQSKEIERFLLTSSNCTEEIAINILKRYIGFYHKDSKIISKIDIFNVDDCSFKASFRISDINYDGYIKQGVVCRVTLDPYKQGSGTVYIEQGYFY